MLAVEVRGRDGEMTLPPEVPVHHLLCDGSGFRRGLSPEDAVPVLCAACRPAAVAARARADRLARFGRSR